MDNKSIKIVHMYPDLLNLYGDRGNIECMRKRLEWRGFDVKVVEHTNKSHDFDLSTADIVFIGGGSDREQKIVSEKLSQHKRQIENYVEANGVLLAVCGGFQLLGNFYKAADSIINGLGILDISTHAGEQRLIGNIVIQNNLFSRHIVGFENHAGRTDIGSHSPLGKVVRGCGNDGVSGFEGVLYKNVTATYLHGPLLPKNPQLCDYILLKAIQNKIPEIKNLTTLDDTLEIMANNHMSC